jgi:hypothetical protein
MKTVYMVVSWDIEGTALHGPFQDEKSASSFARDLVDEGGVGERSDEACVIGPLSVAAEGVLFSRGNYLAR